jgi:uncharacterized protein (TIGR03435 family)
MAVFTGMKASCTAALVLAFAVATVDFAQTKAAFEVASIRPAPAQPTDFNLGLKISGAQVRFAYLSLKDYISRAYRVKPLHIVGPDWLGNEKFDIAATLPDGATPAQIPEMLQRLLEERFHLTIHHEMKEFPVYALETAQGGTRLTELPPDADAGPTPTGTVDATVTGTAAGVERNFGNGSTMMFSQHGFEGKKISMSDLADTLSWYLERPVVDMTGLKGSYDLLLDISAADYRAMSIRAGVVAGIALPPSILVTLDKPWGDSVNNALSKVGLTLAARKSLLEVIVIDRIDRNPTEN